MIRKSAFLILGLYLALTFSLCAENASPSPSASPSSSPSPTPEPTPAPTPDLEEVLQGMSAGQIDKAIAAIKSNYFSNDALSDDGMKRAELEGLIVRLSPGLDIRNDAQNAAAEKKIPFLAEILDSQIGYLRLGSIGTDSLAQMDTALKKFGDQGIKAAIVDLRGCPPEYNYDLAAQFARRFCKKGKMLFSVQKPSAKQERIFTSNDEPLFDGVVIVITDQDDMGAAEAIAAALRASASAMIVGERTAGGAIEYTDVSLGDGKTLRIANAQVVLPEGGSIYPKGVAPDVAVRIDPDLQDEIFRLSTEKGVSQFVFEKERARMSEAALVANTNPEIETVQELRRGGNKPVLRDVALQRAVDLVTTINFYKKQK